MFRVNVAGDVCLCAPTRLAIPFVGNILKDEIDEVWNSHPAQELRRSILDGSFRHCSPEHCPALQKNTLPEGKHLKNRYFQTIIAENLTILPKGPSELNLHYDPTCNLKCPTCRTAILGLKGAQLKRAETLHDLIVHSPTLRLARKIILSGNGEVFASKVHLRFLRGFDRARFPLLRIHLLTNGLLLTPKKWQTISPAHAAIDTISVSVDAATQETYSINRGGDFSRLLENLHFIRSLRQSGKIKHFQLNFVVQANNFREIPALVEMARQLKCDRVLLQKLHDRNCMDDTDQRAVHLTTHPDHAALLEILASEILSDPIVDSYTISDLRRDLSTDPPPAK